MLSRVELSFRVELLRRGLRKSEEPWALVLPSISSVAVILVLDVVARLDSDGDVSPRLD